MSVVNIQQKDISKKNHLQMVIQIINDTAAARTCNGSQPVEKLKDDKRVFIVGDDIIKNLNGYIIGSKTGNCDVYVRPSHSAKVRCMVNHIKPVRRNKPEHIIFPLREKCPNTEFFLVRKSGRIQENTDQKKVRIWTLITQCSCWN